MNKALTILLAVGFLSACSAGNEEPKGVIPEHMEEGMEKADSVDAMLKQADDARREELDSQ